MHYWMVFWNVLSAWNIIKSYFAMLLPCCFTDMTGFKAGDQCESWIQIWKLKKQIQFYSACWVQFDDYMLKKKLKICTRNFFWVEKKRIPDHVEKFPCYWNIKIHIISPLCDILCHIRIRQYSQLSKTDTFGTGPVSVLERCPSYRESR